ncbi:site-2 protease family protein [Spiractinospora alimapuensis]|nr:site-2 protease family protein [Spiractinospora alimapuensis]
MARIAGIPIYVSPSWLIIAAIITVLYEPIVEGILGLGILSYLVAFAFAVLLYASVLVHELAHALVARGYGLPVRRIRLYMLGGVSEIERDPQTPRREFWVAFSGPLLSLVLAGVSFGLYLMMPPLTVLSVLTWQLWVANLLVAVFNLLPGLPLDGGRLLRAGVWAATRNADRGTLAAAWAGRCIAVVVAALPFLLAWWAGTSPQVFGVLLAVLLAAFLWMGATSSLRTARLRRRVPSLRAAELARVPVLVAADTPLAEAERQRLSQGAGAIVVTDSGGEPISMVHVAAADAVPETRRPWVPVSSVSRAITPGGVIPARLSGEDLLHALGAHPAGEYLLRADDGTIMGVLYAKDIQDALSRA